MNGEKGGRGWVPTATSAGQTRAQRDHAAIRPARWLEAHQRLYSWADESFAPRRECVHCGGHAEARELVVVLSLIPP